jgi:hypothetical protein
MEKMRSVAIWFGWVMITLYVAFGLLLMFSDFLITLIPNNRIGFAMIVLAYSGFRIYMTLKLMKQHRAPKVR